MAHQQPNGRVDRIRRSIRQNRSALIVLAILLATQILLAAAYKSEQHKSEHRFCSLFSTLINQSGQAPTTTRGVEIANEIRQLYHEFGCSRQS